MQSDPQIKFFDPAKIQKRNNRACAYCGRPFEKGLKSEEEHVVGKRFVPVGSLAACWNLILNSCIKCNREKSKLETEISAITMQPDAWGRHPNDDDLLTKEALRKGSTLSQVTRKPVSESKEAFKFQAPLLPGVPGVQLAVSFNAPPTLDTDRAYRLAWYQIRGFFYLITYNNEKRIGFAWAGKFAPLTIVRESDWGNSLMVSFQRLVSSWDHRFLGVGEYFSVRLRRSPDSRPLWSWALEWNRSFRLIGFVGNEDAAKECCASLEWPENHIIQDGLDSWLTLREEKRISPEDDRLFELLPEQALKQPLIECI